MKPRGGKILTISPLFLFCNSDPSPFQSIWWDVAVSSALEFHLGLSSTRPLPFRWKSWRARFEGSFQAAHGDMCKLHPYSTIAPPWVAQPCGSLKKNQQRSLFLNKSYPSNPIVHSDLFPIKMVICGYPLSRYKAMMTPGLHRHSSEAVG